MVKKVPKWAPLAASIDALLSSMLHEKKVWPVQCPYGVVDVALKTWEERVL